MSKLRRSSRKPNSPSSPRNATDTLGEPGAVAAVAHRATAAKAGAGSLTLTIPNATLAPGLYVVATPIGNLGDVSLRALATLNAASRIACEDTRITARLLARFGIAGRTIAYHDHNAQRILPRLIRALQDGESVALVSDAGTPLVSDPGLRLVRAAVDAGIAVTTVPGPVAAVAGLTLAGLPVDRFLFAGFLPARAAARRGALAGLAGIPATLIFYEAPHRLAASLADMVAVLGDRNAAVARELTKLFEEVRRDTLAALAAHYLATGAPRGEIVVLVGPSVQDKAVIDDDAIDARLRIALTTMRVRDAAAAVAAETGRRRRDVYARALALSRNGVGENDRCR
jgi:16S rRNA (cytidine1402-2'-O)-methyltransferase